MKQSASPSGSLSLSRFLAICCLYLSYIRATNIGLFYPADEYDLYNINYMPQTLMNFVLLLGIAGYFVLTDDYSFIRVAMARYLPVLLLAGAVLSLGFSVDRTESLKFTLAVVAISAPTLLYRHLFGPDRLLSALGKFALAMAYINLVYTLLFPQYAIMVNQHAGRWKGLFEHKNFAGPFFSVAFYLVLHDVRWRRPAWLLTQLVGMGICLTFVYKSQSSTALVTLAAMAFFYPSMMAIYRLEGLKDRLTVILVLSSLALAILAVAAPVLADLFFAATGKDATLTGRTGIWSVMLDLVGEHPFLGFGVGMSERPDFMMQVHHDVGWDVKSTHNSYIDLLISFGYPEAILILATLFGIWLRALAHPVRDVASLRNHALGASLMLVVFIVSFAGASALASRSIFWLFMVSGATVLAMPATTGKLPLGRRNGAPSPVTVT